MIALSRVAAAVLLLVGGAVGYEQVNDRPAAPVSAPAALQALQVGPPSNITAYRREAFGYGWIDADRDGCDTRAEVLMRDLTDEKVRTDPSCLVLEGGYTDPYTGISGLAIAAELDVDHVVALGDAWRSGAAGWKSERRLAFANDLDNLLAANDTVNRQKSDLGPAGWQPPNPLRACPYAERYTAVKARWGLTVTQEDRDALARMLDGCPR